MAKRPAEDPPKGAPAWQSTFSDLMNLLLCFFVLLFAMSTTDTDKFEALMASIQSSFSILSGGGSAIDEGILISSGVSQLSELSQYYTNMGLSAQGESTTDTEAEKQAEEAFKEELEQAKMEESMEMAEAIEERLEQLDLTSDVEVIATNSYVMLNLSSGILFDSGHDELKEESLEVLSKVGDVILDYDGYVIEIIGHTDNVPIHSAKFPDNTMLSMCRAYSVYRYLVDEVGCNPVYMLSSGRGENVPIADNSTPEGRAQNRRVEIKIYNTFTTGD
ncbi:MAG: flagellar motor protein MotB [Lachnospiraceae bacterium]|nr:flagellar motor protein MotB [Lachnospiraceae bacterium]